MGQNSIISSFFARKAKKASAKGRSPPQEQEVGPRSALYLLVFIIRKSLMGETAGSKKLLRWDDVRWFRINLTAAGSGSAVAVELHDWADSVMQKLLPVWSGGCRMTRQSELNSSGSYRVAIGGSRIDQRAAELYSVSCLIYQGAAGLKSREKLYWFGPRFVQNIVLHDQAKRLYRKNSKNWPAVHMCGISRLLLCAHIDSFSGPLYGIFFFNWRCKSNFKDWLLDGFSYPV